MGHIHHTNTISSSAWRDGAWHLSETYEFVLPRGFTLQKAASATLENRSGRTYRSKSASLSTMSNSEEQRFTAAFDVEENGGFTKIYLGDLVVDLERSEIRHVNNAK